LEINPAINVIKGSINPTSLAMILAR